jgi:hypothetical protein
MGDFNGGLDEVKRVETRKDLLFRLFHSLVGTAQRGAQTDDCVQSIIYFLVFF